jgi:hypothetical protein
MRLSDAVRKLSFHDVPNSRINDIADLIKEGKLG